MNAIELKAGDKVSMGGMEGTIGAMCAYFDSCNYTSEKRAELMQLCIDRGDEQAWVMSRAQILSNSPAFYDRERAEWATVVGLTNGQLVEIEGQTYIAKFVRPGVSDFIRFERV